MPLRATSMEPLRQAEVLRQDSPRILRKASNSAMYMAMFFIDRIPGESMDYGDYMINIWLIYGEYMDNHRTTNLTNQQIDISIDSGFP